MTAENIHVHLMSLNLIIEKYNKWCRNISRSCSCGWLSDKTTRRAQFCTQAWSRIMKDYGEKIGYTRGEYMGVTPPPPPDTHQTQVQNVTLEPVRDNPKAVSGSFSAKTLFYNQITHTLKNVLQTQSIKFPQ